jgi:hypothetical protein
MTIAGAAPPDDQWQTDICETAFCESMGLVVHDFGAKNLGHNAAANL